MMDLLVVLPPLGYTLNPMYAVQPRTAQQVLGRIGIK